MALVNGKHVLQDAKKNKYALGAFNVTTLEGVLGIIEAGEALDRPVILQYAEVHKEWIDLEILGPIMVEQAKKARVPVVVHYDHGKDPKYIFRALELGFTSVMFDGADLSLEENIRQTRKIVKMARPFQACVEGELGSILNGEGGGSAEGSAQEPIHTDPMDARRFVEETGVDLLAVAYGTAHGLYRQRPRLDFQRLEAIARQVYVPLVMHGGSGLNRDEYIRSIDGGICKINYYSDLANKAAKEVFHKLKEGNETGKESYIHEMARWSREVIVEDVKKQIGIFARKEG